ncbi:BglG family transcription antiterminator [Alkalibacterium olivapovliticus]|uniref:Transcriptional antiterminator n=1 Tax=Alkalibacterium olivapovliticus TaxID=99907 RepID=A0A2T0W6P5_9LACT|nr:PTS sugar transporter subunit IIA [Alkalibacterium olivapovliticus]PRY82381.1 transcriptional antiterminator [Alkalibacterium olivapovliticus]
MKKRQVTLHELLKKNIGYKTIRYYSHYLNVSERTIHTDLKTLNSYFEKEGYVLVKKPSAGIKLVKDKENPENRVPDCESNEFSPMVRRRKMLHMLIFKNEILTYESMSEMFHVSQSSINSDIKYINNLLSKDANIQLTSDAKGTRLIAKESQIQSAQITFNHWIINESEGYINENDFEKNKEILSEYYGEDIVNACSRVLYEYITRDANAIGEHYVFNILNVLMVLVHRSIFGEHIEGEFENHTTADSDYYNGAEQLLDKLSLRLNFEISSSDLIYLSSHLLSNKFELISNQEHFDYLAEEVIAKVGKLVDIDLSKDEQLFENLKKHIPPMVYRLRRGFLLKNPFVHQIKREYSVLFNLVWVTFSDYANELNIKFNEDEVGFLSIHFQSAIERSRVSKKILVVCPTGVATSELLVNRISNILPSFTTVKVASIREMTDMHLEDIDLIISTVDIDVDEVKLVVVSPLLSNEDVQNIQSIFNDEFVLSKDFDKNNIKLNNIIPYLQKEFLYLGTNYNKREDCLKEICKGLLDKKIIDSDFLESVLRREQISGTDLPTGVAIPHGSPKFVKKTRVVFIVNNKSIKWCQHSVKLIILICVAEKDIKKIKDILSDIYQIVKSSDFVTLIQNVEDKDDFLNVLKGE